MREKNRVDGLKAPSGELHRDLRPLAAIDEEHLSVIAQEQRREPSVWQWHHAAGP